MTYYNLSALNGTSMEGVYVGIISQAPWITPLLLAFEFLLIMITGITMQNRKIGYSNAAMWGSLAGLVTTTTAFMWSAVKYTTSAGVFTFVDLSTVGICIAVTVAFATWFFLQDLE